MLHEKFIIDQDIETDFLDYSEFNQWKNMLKQIDTLGHQYHWMFDYAKNCFFYLTENSDVFPKRELAYLPGQGYQCLIDNSHPDDILYMLNIQKVAFDFFFNQKPIDRVNYKFTYKMRVLTQSGDYVPFNFQIKAAALDNKGNVWMSLAQGVPSRTERYFKPLVISTVDKGVIYAPDVKHTNIEFELPKLTDREMEMIKLLAKNKTIDEICTIMQVSISTFKFHRKNLLKKLNAPNSYTAVENSRLLGLLKN